MAIRRFKSRATAGRRLKAGTLAQLIGLADIRKGVGRGDGDTGTLVGCVDKDGTNQGASGILDVTSTFYSVGLLDENAAFNSWGIQDDDGVYKGASGILDNLVDYYATTGLTVAQVQDGVTWNDGDGSHEGKIGRAHV